MIFRLRCNKEGENWWFGAVTEGVKMPINSAKDHYIFDGRVNNSYNQIVTLLVSDCGRYIYAEDGCKVEIGDNEVILLDYVGEIDVGEGYSSMKEAYHAAAKKHFYHSQKTVPPIMLESAQYCSWVEMLRGIHQRQVEEYVSSVKEANLPAGCFICDDGWMQDYGDWEFVIEKFPNPKQMCEKIHALGFKIMLWVCPFVHRSAKSFKQLEEQGFFIKTPDGETAMRNWWNGQSAVLDMTNPGAWSWLKGNLDRLMKDYGVDGFKFDAGDAEYYRFDDLTFEPITPNGQSVAWAKFAAQYEYSELRACVGMSGYPIVQRLSDKDNSWDNQRGLGALIPNMVQAGLAGYAYCCPDMVGGGQEANFGGGKEHDVELFIRSCQCVALMPMMQFSYAIWKHYANELVQKTVKDAAYLRLQYKDYFHQLLQESIETQAPIMRNLEYAYPNQGLYDIKDQFMLGDKLLVAPVLKKGERSRKVVLPSGNDWKYIPTGKVYQGGQTIIVDAPLEILPYFEKVQ